MADKIKLQAHRGVSTEFPENTMAAYRAAYVQGYDVAELDPAFTKDGVCVMLHDSSLNRTARYADGTELEEPIKISDINFSEARKYDFGIYFSKKFKNEKIPTLDEVLEFSAKCGMPLKIDNKVEKFTEEQKNVIFEAIRKSGAPAGMTCKTLDFALRCAKELPKNHIHYDGEVTLQILGKLHSAIEKKRLTVWLRMDNAATSFSSLPPADEKLCREVKKYASLGIWIISDAAEMRKAAYVFGADIIETAGKIKPKNMIPGLVDCHIHTDHSHDGHTPMEEQLCAAEKLSLAAICIADHADIERMDVMDFAQMIRDSYAEASKLKAEHKGNTRVLCGVEMGDPIWDDPAADAMIAESRFDAVLGSVHTVRYADFYDSFSRLDFSHTDIETVYAYLDKYFDEISEMTDTSDFDVLCHLTNPMRYFNGKYKFGVDLSRFDEKIKSILSRIIKKGIALEINTSGVGIEGEDLMPDERILKMYRSLGGYLVTLGSDAHVPQNVGRGFDKAKLMLLKNGFENAYYYKERVPVPYSLIG